MFVGVGVVLPLDSLELELSDEVSLIVGVIGLG